MKILTLSTIMAAMLLNNPSIAQDGPPNGVPYSSVPATPIKKCLNMGNMFEQPPGQAWNGRLPNENDYKEISALGFDTVRLPVRWSAYADEKAPYKIETKFLATIDANVAYATKYGLNIIIDLHHYDEIFKDPEAHSDRFVAIWEQLAIHYQNQPKSVMFELLNEPHDKLTNAIVEPLLERTLAVVRKTNQTRKVIVGGENWSHIDSLKTFDPPKNDPNIISTFHFYEPFQFSHQGASWVNPSPPAPASFGSDADYQWVVKMENAAIDFMQRTGVPLLLGEFGAIDTANLRDRAKHSYAIRRTAEGLNIGWCAWSYTNTFHVRNDKGWIFEMLAALGIEAVDAEAVDVKKPAN